jgi:hypothetical protein
MESDTKFVFDVETFHQKGFVLIPNFCPEEVVHALRSEIASILANYQETFEEPNIK